MSVPFVYVNGTLNLILKGKSYQITPDHPSYGLVKKSLATSSEDELLQMCDVQKSMSNFVEKESKGRAVVSGGQVYFDGKPVHNTLSDRVLQFMKEGLPFSHLLKFMENVSENPSYQSQQELFDFLQNKSLPITEDGQFLAYKAVLNNWMDKYSGTISNKIGNVVEVKRGAVDDNRCNECSKGLHCGALDYVYGYGGGTDRIIIVKVNPRDAVSVPKDASFQKLRTCRYEVVGEFSGELKSPLYTAKAEEVTSPTSDSSYDWAWADRNYDDLDKEYDHEEDDYDEDGYDQDGYDEDGYDWDGYDRDGYDEDGFDELGYDRDGNDMEDDDEDDYTGGVKVNDKSVNLGRKPSGQFYHNKRDSYGRFVKR